MDKTNHSLAKNIKAIRKQKGWTQVELAKKLNCSQEMITYYEKSERKPPADKIPILANILEVSIDQLFGTKPIKNNGNIKNPRLWKKFEQLENLPQTERKMVFKMIDGMLAQQTIAKKDKK